MRSVKVLVILVIVLAALALGLSSEPKTSLASSSGKITSVCYDPATSQVFFAVNAIGNQNDSGGFDQIGAAIDTGAYHAIKFDLIPADGQFHTHNFTFDNVPSSSGVFYCAGDGDGHGHPIGPGFDGCAFNVTLPTCKYAAQPIPTGFMQYNVVCNSPVYDQPAGQPVGSNAVTAGQTWYVNPKPVKGSDGKQWSEIFLGGSNTAFIPTSCVGTLTPFN